MNKIIVRQLGWASWLLGFFVAISSFTAHAKIVRHAIIIGNNQGAAGELPLRYAHHDANKLYQTLHALGGFHEENMVLMLEAKREAIWRVLVAVNDRIRQAQGRHDQAVLFVYYSGHADAQALHLGPERLELDLLEQMVRGSSADFRVLVLDACRSASTARAKGGRQVPAFPIQIENRLAGEGMVTMTSASLNESAQESDALGGSFFTHYFISGLMGAADINHDAQVTVQEAYNYAYGHTLRASSQTLLGIQHPSYEFDTQGQGILALTRIDRPNGDRGRMWFPRGREYLLFAHGAQGTVVAEIGAHDAARTISVPAGRYFVRGRTPSYLLEGELELRGRHLLKVDDAQLRRVEYARLARKGGHARTLAHGPEGGYQMRVSFQRPHAPLLCHGARLGYGLEFRYVSAFTRLGYCRSQQANALVRTTRDEIELELGVLHLMDVRAFSFGFGLSLGVASLRQTYQSQGHTPQRHSFAGTISALTVAQWSLPWGLFAQVELAGQVYAYRRSVANEDSSAFRASFSMRPLAGIGKRF